MSGKRIFADALHDDVRKSAAETFLTETGYFRGEICFALKHLKSWTKPHRVSVPLLYQPAKASYSLEPYGVVLVIGAWNYPLQLSLAPDYVLVHAKREAKLHFPLSEAC